MRAGGQPAAERLLAEARGGRREALGDLLELYRNYLHLLARTQIDLHVQGRVSPSDVVQETFLQACRRFNQFQGKSEQELLGWLRSILVRNLAQLVERQVLARKRDVRREVSLDRQLERSVASLEAALANTGSSPSSQAQRRELAARVADQLARLPAHYREVIVLRNLEGLAFEEVARRMGRSTGAVRVLWLRALNRLRRLHGEGDGS